jgi:hypothetical protein
MNILEAISKLNLDGSGIKREQWDNFLILDQDCFYWGDYGQRGSIPECR